MRPNRRSRLPLSVVAALVTAYTPGATAGASAAGPAIQVSPPYGPPMTVIKVTGVGFCTTGCGSVSVLIGALYVVNDVKVGSDGRFSTTVQVPDTVPSG